MATNYQVPPTKMFLIFFIIFLWLFQCTMNKKLNIFQLTRNFDFFCVSEIRRFFFLVAVRAVNHVTGRTKIWPREFVNRLLSTAAPFTTFRERFICIGELLCAHVFSFSKHLHTSRYTKGHVQKSQKRQSSTCVVYNIYWAGILLLRVYAQSRRVSPVVAS